MRRDLRQVAADVIRRNDHHNALAGAVAGVGAAIAIGVMEWFSLESHYPLVIIPFATSIVLVIGSPQVEPAQPRALIGGHVVSTLAGLAVLHCTGPQAWAGRRCRRVGRACDVCHRHVSSAGGNQPAAGGLQQPAMVVSFRTGAGGRVAADRLCLSLAPLGPPPAMAAALAMRHLAGRGTVRGP